MTRGRIDGRELREALRDASGGPDGGARDRSWEVVRAAYAEAGPARPRPRRRRALAGAVALSATVAGVAAASAPDSGVGRWVRDVLGTGAERARPALVRVPGGGRLLVQAGDGAWLVAADGAKRRLGRYAGASWSPHGRFAVAWRGRELTAVDPRGRVRWSLARARPVGLARWSPVDGFRIAYLAGGSLRVVNGDGTGDERHAAARAGVAPAWRPDAAHVVAYVDPRGRATVAAVDARRRLWRSAPLRDPVELAWSADGSRLLAVTRRRVVAFSRDGRRLRVRPAGAGAAFRDAAWAPRGLAVALVRRRAGAREEVVLADGRRERVLFTGPGRLGPLAWSPSGRILLVPWEAADQWLFLRPHRGAGRPVAVANVAAQLQPGATTPRFPASVEWCCRRPPAAVP